MPEGQRCQFQHEVFRLYNADTGYQCDDAHHCWVTDTVRYRTDYGMRYYCHLHAPEGQVPDKQRSDLLTRLVVEWGRDNTNRGKAAYRAFVLPGLRCGDIPFSHFIFSGPVRFDEATISGDAWFHKAIFWGDAEFRNARFDRTVHCDQALFFGNADFTLARFARHLTIDSAWFLGTLTLEDNTFEFPANLTGCRLHDLKYRTHSGARLFINGCRTVDIENGTAKDAETGKPFETQPPEGEWSSHGGSGVLTFEKQHCEHITFQNMNLSRADFRGADVSKTRFISCRWKEPGQPHYPQVWGHPKGLLPSEREDTLNLEVFKNTYEQLKNNLEGHRDFVQAGAMHYWEMELRRWMLQERIFGKISSLRGWLADCTREIPELAIFWVYRTTAEYGENYVRLGVTIFFTLCAATWGVGHYQGLFEGGQGFWATFKDVLFALVPTGFQKETLTTLKLTDASKWVMLTEVVALLTLLPLFIMAVRRRFRR